MDATDEKILCLLQQNARIPLSEIGKLVSLSTPSVSERVQKLRSSGVIKDYTAILDAEAFGKHLCCYCFLVLRNKTTDSSNGFIEFIRNEPEILGCDCVSGEYEYLLKIVTESSKSLEALLEKIRSKIPIMRSNTFIVLSTIKENFSISPVQK